MEDDIKALREEIAKLRERVAVLESRQAHPLNQLQNPNPMWPSKLLGKQHAPPGSPHSVTC